MREPMTIVEIDFDYCTRTFGVAPCQAVMTLAVPRKCFNSYRTCVDRPNYQKSTKTIRFCEPRSNLPVGVTLFPAVVKISESSASVNIAGSDERMSALGERAQVRISFQDFIHHDRGMDKYALERVSGVAQLDGIGYNPQGKGSFFGKFSQRFPYMTGRSLRVIEGYIDSGAFVELQRRNYVIDEIGIPDEDGIVDLVAKDVLEFAADDKAVVPKPSSGVIDRDIDTAVTSFALSPAGIGNAEYPASGRAVIGSEMVYYVRSGDSLSVTRAIQGTKVASHKLGDTFQVVFAVAGMRVDDFIYTVIRDYTKTPVSFMPLTSKWRPEIDRWAPGVLLTTDITVPTGVTKIIGELASLGFIVSWSSVHQEIGLKVNRPVDRDQVYSLNDDNHIKRIVADKREDDRLSQVVFFTVQSDPTKSLTDWSNYNFALNRIDVEAQSVNEYSIPKIKNIPVRFFNSGADNTVSVLAKRLLNRFRDPPTLYTITLDAKDFDIDLTEVVEVTSSRITDAAGIPVPTQLQVIRRNETKPGHEFEIVAQAYQFSGKYAFITENSRPKYMQSSKIQKATGAYFSNNGAAFADGGLAYRFI